VSLPAITIVVEPPRVDVPVSTEGEWADETADYRELAAALGRHTTARVEVVVERLCRAPEGALIVVSSGYDAMMAECPAATREETAARSLLLDVDRSDVFELLETHRFAGAVEKHRWFQWRRQREQESGGGLHGLRALAPAIGGTCLEVKSFQSEHYCVLRSERFTDLASLIVGYLETLAVGGKS
jgi:hypothetical protein